MLMKTADAHCDTLFNFYFNPFHSKNAAWSIEKFKKSGLLLRVSNRSRLSIDEHVKNISHWFSGYKPIINIIFM